MSSFERLKALTEQISTHEISRKKSLKRLEELFMLLDIGKKHEDFGSIFEYKAMNLSGISLDPLNLAQPKQKRYAQIIAIEYVDDRGVKRAKNLNLAYFGRAENIEPQKRRLIVEFILRWRYEKSFKNVEHYDGMITQLQELE